MSWHCCGARIRVVSELDRRHCSADQSCSIWAALGKPCPQRSFPGWIEEGLWARKEPAAPTSPRDRGIYLLVLEAVSALWIAFRWTLWVKVVTMRWKALLHPKSLLSSSGREKCAWNDSNGNRYNGMLQQMKASILCSSFQQEFEIPKQNHQWLRQHVASKQGQYFP